MVTCFGLATFGRPWDAPQKAPRLLPKPGQNRHQISLAPYSSHILPASFHSGDTPDATVRLRLTIDAKNSVGSGLRGRWVINPARTSCRNIAAVDSGIPGGVGSAVHARSEEHTSELQSPIHL